MPQQNEQQNRVAIVTAAGSGMGAAIARRLAEDGYRLALFSSSGRAEALAEELGALGVTGSNLEPADLQRLTNETVARYGRIDALVNSAGHGPKGPLLEIGDDDWHLGLEVYLLNVIRMCRLVVPHMTSGGAIVNISSPGSRWVLPDYSVVGASKAALEALTRYLAVELAPMNIVVNAISPGVVDTEAIRHFAVLREDPHLLDRAVERTPAGRLAEPDDIAAVVAFLCSPAAAMIRGQTILVDGGYTLPLAWM